MKMTYWITYWRVGELGVRFHTLRMLTDACTVTESGSLHGSGSNTHRF